MITIILIMMMINYLISASFNCESQINRINYEQHRKNPSVRETQNETLNTK